MAMSISRKDASHYFKTRQIELANISKDIGAMHIA